MGGEGVVVRGQVSDKGIYMEMMMGVTVRVRWEW